MTDLSNASRQDLIKGVYTGFRSAGLSHEAALVMVGEVGRENAYHAKYLFGTHSDPHNKVTNTGLISWQGPRKVALDRELTAQGLMQNGRMVQSQAALNAQAKFLVNELKTQNPDVYDYLQSGNVDANRGMDMVGRKFIRWRIDDPKYRNDGLRNREYFYNEGIKAVGTGESLLASAPKAEGDTTFSTENVNVTVKTPESLPSVFTTKSGEETVNLTKTSDFSYSDLLDMVAKSPVQTYNLVQNADPMDMIDDNYQQTYDRKLRQDRMTNRALANAKADLDTTNYWLGVPVNQGIAGLSSERPTLDQAREQRNAGMQDLIWANRNAGMGSSFQRGVQAAMAPYFHGWERFTQESADPGFTQDKREQLYKKMVTDQGVNVGTIENWTELQSSNSEDQFMRRLAAIKIESDDSMVLRASGTPGTIGYFAGSMVDPLLVIPGLGAEKVAWNVFRSGSKIAQLSKTAKAAAAAGDVVEAGAAVARANAIASPARQIASAAGAAAVANVAAEAALSGIDDTRASTISDYALAGAIGAVLGGGARGLGMMGKGADLMDPEVRASLDESLAAISKYAEVNDTLKAKWNDEAKAELGDAASPEAIQGRVIQKEIEHAKKPLDLILAVVPDHMKAPGVKSVNLAKYLKAEKDIEVYLENARNEHNRLVSETNKTVASLKRERAVLQASLSRLSTTGEITKSLQKRTRGIENENLIPEAERPATPEIPDSYDGFVPSDSTAGRVSRAMSEISNEVDIPLSMRSRVMFKAPEEARFADIASAYAWAIDKGDGKKSQKRLRKAIEEYIDNSKLDRKTVETYGRQLLDVGDGKRTGNQVATPVALRQIEETQRKLTAQHAKNALSEYQSFIGEVRRIRAGMTATERLAEIDDSLAKADLDISEQTKAIESLEASNSQMLLDARQQIVGNSTAADNARAAARKDVWVEAIENEKSLPELNDRLKKVMKAESKAGHFSTHSTITQTSQNPIIRTLGYIMGESPYSIHGGRNAATVKFMLQRMLRGNLESEVNVMVDTVLKRHGNSPARRFTDKTKRDAIYSEFFRFMENRRNGIDNTGFPDGDIYTRLAQSVERQTQMMLDMGKHLGLDGYDLMPDKSIGWLPFVIDPDKFRKLIGNSRENRDAFVQAMYQSLMDGGMFGSEDKAKVLSISRQYVEIMTSKALDKQFIASSPFSRTGNGQVELAIKEAKDLSDLEKEYYLKKFRTGGRETMRRLERNANDTFIHPETGNTMRLSDIMVKDPSMLLNGHINRLSGELALKQFGLDSKRIDLMIEAAGDPLSGRAVATDREIRAIREMQYEFNGEVAPGGNMPKAMQDWATLTRVVRLGGMFFAQTAEMSVAMLRFGLGKTAKFFPEMPRLISEARANAIGAHGTKGVLGDFDTLTGGILGTDYFRHTGSHWSLTADVPAYRDTDVSMVGGMLSSLENLQGKMTFFHHMISAQQRFAAEGIANDLVDFLTGKASKRQLRSLSDAGFMEDLLERLKADSANVIELGENGQFRLTLGKITNKSDGADVMANIERGMSQVIQDRKIGEGGHWQHEWAWRFALQFRNYSILAMTKQTGRIYANQGAWALAGSMIGAMSIVIPVQILRSLAATVGMSEEDRDAALAKALDPGALVYQSFGYLSQAGIAPELLDVGAGFAGADFSRARFEAGGGVVGRISPALGLADQIGTGIAQHDPEKVIKAAPFSGAFPVKQILNALFSTMDDE